VPEEATATMREHAGATSWRQLRGAVDTLDEAATLAARATGGNGGRRSCGSTRGRRRGRHRLWGTGADGGTGMGGWRQWRPTHDVDNGGRRTAPTMVGAVVGHGLDRDLKANVQVVWSFGN
jgi:hypothetical protein